MFENITFAADDPILGLTEEFNRDPRPYKINLGVGIYKNEASQTPVLATVKKAERFLLENEQTKSYLSIQGSQEYASAVQALLFGEHADIITEQRCHSIQSPGGTGAVYLGAQFIARQLGKVTVWLSNPTWVNHQGIFNSAGLTTQYYDYYDANSKTLNFTAMMASLEQAQAGDVILLHGCCHNPTGIDPTEAQWQELATFCRNKGLLPFFDFAYQGFSQGLTEDARGLLLFIQQCDELLVASSFSKNAGLYKERVGALTLVAKTKEQAAKAFSQIKTIARVTYSNPPAHGASVVTHILTTPALRAEWEQEVAQMRERIQEMRALFVKTLKACGVTQDFEFINNQNGMFSYSGLTPTQVAQLKEEHAVYIVNSGRISVAGMTHDNMLPLCKAIAAVL